MSVIIPAILPSSKKDLEDKLALLAGHATSVQVDSVDGIFAAPACWPYSGQIAELAAMAAADNTLPHFGEFEFEADLMVGDIERAAELWINAGASRVTIHAEGASALDRLLGTIDTRFGHDEGFSTAALAVGIAIGVETEFALIEPFLAHIDYVQLMGIRRIGVQGEPFDPSVLRKIAAIRKRHPQLPLQVDGGVSRASAPALLAAGVSRLIVGSALWNSPDPLAELAAFEEMVEQYGIYE